MIVIRPDVKFSIRTELRIYSEPYIRYAGYLGPDIRYSDGYPVFGRVSGIRMDIRYSDEYPVFGRVSGIRTGIRYSDGYPVFGWISGI